MVPPWPKALGVALVIAVASLGATPAFAAPEWGIEMSHANAYGLQAGECPGGMAKYVPGNPEEDCGVDPFTRSGTTFSQESGFNTYTITVKNTAPPTASSSVVPGDTLSCETGTWYDEEPTSFVYHWLRNSVPIAGAESDEHEVTVADEGTALQCEVTAANAGSALAASSAATSVAPAPATAPPVLTAHPEATEEGAGGVGIGRTLTCASGGWEGNPTFAYQWLRNGAPIAGAESHEYVVAASDEGTAIECQVTATNAGGSVVGENLYPIVVAPQPSPYPPYTEYNPGPTIPAPPPPNEARGTVTVADQLPPGLILRSEGQPAVAGSGWTCAVAPTARGFTCTREDSLAPGAQYPPITSRVYVEPSASDSVTNTVSAAGGGAATAVAYERTGVAPAVPFGIQTFTTSVSDGLGNSFTQAGGHPVSANATIVFNYTVSDGGTLEVAGGTPKTVETELPPGFIGDPQSATQCTSAEYQEEKCPRSSMSDSSIPKSGIKRPHAR